MSQADYESKLRNVHRFIPFLENMITQLKDPKMKNREQQLSKMESLYQMITDKKKKLKIDTLQKCEEVIIKLYYKVKGENAGLPPVFHADKMNAEENKRKPINLYSLVGDSLSKSSNPSELPGEPSSSISKSPRPKGFPMRKPPISYSDLECLEKDVALELVKKMSRRELDNLRDRICKELEDGDEINTTVRNKPVLAKLNAASPDKNKKKIETSVAQPKNEVKKDQTAPKKTEAPKVVVPKILKEGDLFCNAFSEIDKTYEMGLKKKDERKLSTQKEKKETQTEDAVEKTLKQLSERAAQLRKLVQSTEATPVYDTINSKPEQNQSSPSNSEDIIGIPLEISSAKTDDSNNKDDKEKKSDDSNNKDDKDKCVKESSNKREEKHEENREKSDKNRKTDHKKDKEDKHKGKHRDRHKKDHHKDRDRKDHSKDKSSRERSGKPTEKKVDKDRKTTDKEVDSKVEKKDSKEDGDDKETHSEGEKSTKSDKIATKPDEANVDPQSKASSEDLEELTKKIEEIMNANLKTQQILQPETRETPQVQEEVQKKPPEEVKAVCRDPRLKNAEIPVVTSAKQNSTPEPRERLAFKYNPKPKTQEIDSDLDKNVLDSIEKSMKESTVPLPPPSKLKVPPAPPDDLFSPESPDEIDQKAVPPILNDLLLNPETTGVINEVVSALRRSNNEKNIMSTATPVCNNEPKHVGKTAVSQAQVLHFSPPPHGLQFNPPQADNSIFVPPNKIVNSSRGFNRFSPSEQVETGNDRKIPDYPMTRTLGPRFEPPNKPRFEPPNNPRLNTYDDRVGQGFYMDMGYPSTPTYVPPSPVYEANPETYRDMSYQNYQNNPQRFFEGEQGMMRPKGPLGDANRMAYNYPQQNYDNYGRFGLRGHAGNQMEPRYFGRISRDPRIHMNRAPQFPVQDPRPMTYRDYKEQKIRETREREMREKELREKEAKLQKEREEAEQKAKAALEREEAEKKEKEAENEKKSVENEKKLEEREREDPRFNDRGRSRNRSRDRYSRNRSSSRYRKDHEDRDDWRSRGDRKDRNERRGRSRERSRYGESKFDKVYSTRDKMDKDLSTPLGNFFNSKTKVGAGYSTQYKIPKKVKEAEPPKEDDKTNDNSANQEVKVDEKTVKEKTDESASPEKKSTIKEKEVIEIKIGIEIGERDKVRETNQMQNENISETKVEVQNSKENDDKERKTEEKNPITEPDKQIETKEEKSGEKKEEEENILSKFFTNLMKSGNKDEKKGALLSLISTFSDSFSDQQMQKITSIIKTGDVEEQPKIEELPTTSTKEETVNTEESKSITEESSEKNEEQTETNTEEENIVIEEETEINKKEEPVERSTRQTVAAKAKNRRKSENQKIEIKSKMKVKSELDRLHDDIREMFIRDGVVTASGKRMCRLLKDNSGSPTDCEKVEEEPVQEEPEKKPIQAKRRGRKPGWKKNRDTPDVEMKELSVILPKMKLEKVRSEENSDKVKGEDAINCHEEEEADESLDVSEEETSDKEIEVNKGKNIRTKKGRQRKRNSWATGVIRKPGPKSRKQKALISPERNGTKSSEPDAEADLEHNLEKVEPLDGTLVKKNPNLHDKDYYFKVGQKTLQCKLCDVTTKWIAAHYRTEHPEEDVLCSRLSPKIAEASIKDAIENKELYENDDEESLIKHEFTCSFCEYKQVTLPRMYRDHVSIHTGEFRHKCPYCHYSRSHIKSMQCHVAEAHAEEEAVQKKPIISQRAPVNRNVYAHICQVCNFTQMSLENIEKHVKTYHSDVDKCDIFKIKINANFEEKIEDDDNKPLSERPTRRSVKLTKSQEVEAVLSDAEETKPSTDSETEKPSPRVAKKKDESAGFEKEEKSSETLEGDSSIEEEVRKPLRGRKKRAKSVGPVSPPKKRLKRKCTLKVQPSGDDAEKEVSDDEEEKVVKNIDVAVFTSNTDIQEENKRIEEERMKTMQDINSTIKLRTSLDFVDKLSHRLKQEEEVAVKQEAVEENVLEKLPVNDLPVFEKSALQNREIETAPARQDSCPKVAKDSGINGVIEKLQGILGSQTTPPEDVASPGVSSEELSLPAPDLTPDDTPPSLEVVYSTEPPPLKLFAGEPNNQPPPLIHMDNVEQTIEKNSIINSETLNIGFVKIIKTMSTYIYVCCLPPCIFSTRDRAAFASHCKYYHQWDENKQRNTECFECAATITSDDGTNLLTSALNHALADHSGFLGTKIGSIRISSNLFPDTKPKEEDEVDPGDAPLNPPTISIPSPPGCSAEDLDSLLDMEPIKEDQESENPFSFKIVDVVSLADEDLPPLPNPDQDGDGQNSDTEPGPSQVQESTPTSPKENSLLSALMLKYQAKQVALTSRKTPVALKKFLGNHFDLYKCPDYSCLFTTNKRKMFDIHLRMHPNHKKLMNCLYCDKLVIFESTGDHYENMHGMCRFSCSYCLYRCIAKDYMDIHQLLAHPDAPSRMQLLPKRDSEEKNSISILSEATKGAPLKPYICCSMDFTHQEPFQQHVDNCPINKSFSCYHKTVKTFCQIQHNSSKELVQHWGSYHGVYPLQCFYCEIGDFDLNAMMIHLVLDHPTLPPDIVDRYSAPVSKSKKSTGVSSVQCNFKQLANDLRSNLKEPCLSTPDAQPPPVTPSVITPIPSTMQKAFENFVVEKTLPSVLKTVSTYSKVTPISIMKKSPPSISLLKPTSKANVLNAGGLVYCLSPASSSQNQLLKAIVVNSDNTVGTVVPQKVQLVTSPTLDRKFQIIKNITNVVPIAPKMVPIAPKGISFEHKMPKLAPLTAIQHVSPTKIVPVPPNQPNVGQEATEASGEVSDASSFRKEDGAVDDVAGMEGLEEPMVIFGSGLGHKEQDDAVDPLSLETEDPLNAQPPKSPRPNAHPSHEYDSDSKDVDHQDVVMQKTGLVGYQLFRCAKCDMFFPGGWQLKDHLINAPGCRFDNVANKPYKCYHCNKYLKHYTNLLDHLAYHGHPRFTCSLCNKKFPHANQAKYHMKTQHNVLNVQMQPLIQGKSNMNNDSFIAKPQVVGSVKPVIQENKSESDTQKSNEVKTVYFSYEADQIPQKSILGYDVTCGHCKKFKNKVRSNIVRHLLLHQNDKEFSVPDTAPVNPVPCLEKNEKMFDKMYNLASSSHTGGRMGGQQKGETNKDKTNETNHPAFVPMNKRYQCCAVGCNYLCLEEGNLRHHLTALHMEDLNFVCVHCKSDLSDAADVDTIIKHLKLHDLHLYKCNYCDYMHNLRHKIDRHIKENHKNKDVSVVVIRAMDAEPYDDNQQQPYTPAVVNQKLQKLWKCCMCKYKCHTEEEVVNHVKNKHNIDCRYKCALCTFKTNEVPEFKEHFKKYHPDNEIDIILLYHKDDEANGTVTEIDQFDTTPLWLRDKPRVRHIRGILFEEDPAMKKKSTQLKSSEQVTKELPGSSMGKKRKRSMSTHAEPNKLDEESLEPKKEVPEIRTGNIQENTNVIVIDDDETEGKEVKTVGSVDEQENDVDLICMFGDVGMPLNKHFKCPKCEKYKTTKMREFIQHVAGEVRYHRFLCKICQEKFITLESIQMHCIDYHDSSVSSVSYIPVDPPMNKWLSLLLKEQRSIIKGLGFACEEIPSSIEDFFGRIEVIQKKIKCKECGFSVSGPNALNRHMKYNHPHIAFNQPSSSSPVPDPPRPQANSSDKKRKSAEPAADAPGIKKLKTLSRTNSITKDKYVCKECKAEFYSVPEMEFHNKEIHGKEIQDGCSGYTVKTTSLPIGFGVNRNVYRCIYCPNIGTKANLEIHISTDHPGQKIEVYRFSCGVCSAKFDNLRLFRHHFKVHDLPEMFYYDVHDRRMSCKAKSGPAQKNNKIYKCPLCTYNNRSYNTANIKHHLRLHAKAFKCELCQTLFKTRSDARSHHLKEHPHNPEVITTIKEMVEKINKLMEEILENVIYIDETEESMEEDVSFAKLQPEVILKTSEDEVVDIESHEPQLPKTSIPEGKRYFARKSTSAPAKPDQEYSFYGRKADPVDMKKIVTNFEIADAKMKMTCDQLGKIYNLNPTVRLKDCMTLIIEDDDDVSS